MKTMRAPPGSMKVIVRTLFVSVDCDCSWCGLLGSPVKMKTSSRFESGGSKVTEMVLVWLLPT